MEQLKHAPAGIGPILRAADVLKSFKPGEILRFRDIMERTGLPRLAAHRVMQSLVIAELLHAVKPRGYESGTLIARKRRYRIGYASQNEKAQFAKSRCLIEQQGDLAIEFAIFQGISASVASCFRAAHIPVISVESPMPGTIFFRANNNEAGLIAGKALARWSRMHWSSQIDGMLRVGLPGAGAAAPLRMSGTLAGYREALLNFTADKVTHLDGKNTFEGSRRAVGQWLRTAKPGSNPIGSAAYFPMRYGECPFRLSLAMMQNRPVPLANFVSHRLVPPDNVDRLYPIDRFPSLPDVLHA